MQPQKSVPGLIGRIYYHYFLFIFPLRSTTPSFVFQSAAGVKQPSVWTTARRTRRCPTRPKVLCRTETVACGGNRGGGVHLNALPLVSTVISTAAAESQTNRFPRFSAQSRFKLSTQEACLEKLLLPGVSSLKGAQHFPVPAFFKVVG